MNLLKRKLGLHYLRNLPSLKRFEICDKLHPFIVQYSLALTENEICFPQPLCDEQKTVYFIANCDEKYRRRIPFADIVYMGYCNQRLRLVIRTGHIFYFYPNSKIWMIINTLGYNNPIGLVVWWWKISGWLVIQWWKLIDHRQLEEG